MLTTTQQRIYDYIKNYLTKHGYAPTLVEIAQKIDVRSKSLISRYVHVLEQQGYIEYGKKGHRNIALPKKTKNRLPLLGRIAAGQPIEAIEQHEYIEFDHLLKGKNYYALQVKGDSMIDEGILDGDIVICEKRETAREGEIVVALIDQENATLKRIRYTKNKVELIPANSSLTKMSYAPSRVQIQGVFIGLLRLPHSASTKK
jgi:repressor LexA